MVKLLAIPNDATAAYHRSDERDFLSEFNPICSNGERFFDEVRFLNWRDESDNEYCGVKSHAFLKDKSGAYEIMERLSSGEVSYNDASFEGIFRRNLGNVAGKIIEYKPDIVRTFNSYFAAELGSIVSKEFGIPLVVSTHDPTRLTGAIRRADRLVCESNELRGTCIQEYGVDSDKISVIHNPIDMDFFRPYSEEEVKGNVSQQWERAAHKVLSVSRLVDGKNIEGLLEALSAMKDDYPGLVHYHFGVGSSKKVMEIKALRDSLGLDGTSFFRGGVQKSELPFYYSSADVFALPTLWEGLSRSVREALASGTPAVTTNYGSTAEIVQDGKNGIGIDPTSSKEIERGLREIFWDTGLRHELTENARKSVFRKYNAESSMRMHCENYQKALEEFVK
jgi:glycosyltransferase involved in cell wall biosynthesis